MGAVALVTCICMSFWYFGREGVFCARGNDILLLACGFVSFSCREAGRGGLRGDLVRLVRFLFLSGVLCFGIGLFMIYDT